MTFVMAGSYAQSYAQFLSRFCIKCNMYPKYILDSVSKFNGCCCLHVSSCYFAPQQGQQPIGHILAHDYAVNVIKTQTLFS